MPLPLALLGIKTLPWKWIGAGLLALALLAIIGAATLHYRGLLAENKQLALDKAALSSALDEQRAATDETLAAVDNWSAALDNFSAAVRQLALVRAEAEAERRRLDDLLASHDLEALAVDDPAAAERLADDFTSRIFGVLQCGSGGPCPAEGGAAPAGNSTAGP